VATADLKRSLTAVYVAHRGLPAAEVAGTAPNSVYAAGGLRAGNHDDFVDAVDARRAAGVDGIQPASRGRQR
jgi:hypothetical protein